MEWSKWIYWHYDAAIGALCKLIKEENKEEKRVEELGLKSLSPDEFRCDPYAVNEWFRSTGAKKVLVHFDVDVLDPEESRMTNCTEPNGMKIAEVVESIRGLAGVCEIVCLTLSEHIPIVEIQLQRMLNELPLFQ